MSSALPPRPSLDHLKKQAKALLKRLREERPDALLTDAQHALAREYGFASWPKLKAAVEAFAKSPAKPRFDRFTAKARESLFFSRYEASEAGKLAIEPEHVLLGLVRASQRLAGRIFERVPLSLEAARVAIDAVRAEQPGPSTVAIPFGDRTKQVFVHAVEEADRFRHEQIGLAHLLLGVLRDPASPAAIALGRNGVRLDSVRDGIAVLLNESPATS